MASAERNTGRQRQPAAKRVNHGGTGKVDIAKITEKGASILMKRAAPCPVNEDRIDHRTNQDRAKDIGGETHAFRHRAGHDGDGGPAEHGLEDKKDLLRGGEVGKACKIKVDPDRQYT